MTFAPVPCCVETALSDVTTYASPLPADTLIAQVVPARSSGLVRARQATHEPSECLSAGWCFPTPLCRFHCFSPHIVNQVICTIVAVHSPLDTLAYTHSYTHSYS